MVWRSRTESELSRILEIPDERIRVGKYLVISQVSRGIPGLKWIGLYGSFWNVAVVTPRDIDLALDGDKMSLSLFEQRVART